MVSTDYANISPDAGFSMGILVDHQLCVLIEFGSSLGSQRVGTDADSFLPTDPRVVVGLGVHVDTLGQLAFCLPLPN